MVHWPSSGGAAEVGGRGRLGWLIAGVTSSNATNVVSRPTDISFTRSGGDDSPASFPFTGYKSCSADKCSRALNLRKAVALHRDRSSHDSSLASVHLVVIGLLAAH